VISIWTEDLIDTLKGLLAKGFSSSGIAAEIGTTRNAVCGKIHRLGLNGGDGSRTFVRRTPEEKEATKRAKMERRNERRRSQRVTVVRVRQVNLEALRCVEVIPQHKSLLELDADGCRFPYGDGPFTFCNHAQHEGSSYCGPHMALSRRRMS
jgi:GcrA cell cycle regulator